MERGCLAKHSVINAAQIRQVSGRTNADRLKAILDGKCCVEGIEGDIRGISIEKVPGNRYVARITVQTLFDDGSVRYIIVPHSRACRRLISEREPHHFSVFQVAIEPIIKEAAA